MHSVLLPMAIESKPLQMSLVAWSSAHLSRISKTHEITALENRSSALVHVASSLRTTLSTSSDYDTMLASCLVLCGAEIALGDTDSWYRHLQGARQVILAAKGRGKGGKELRGTEYFMGSADGQWLLRNFALIMLPKPLCVSKYAILTLTISIFLASRLSPPTMNSGKRSPLSGSERAGICSMWPIVDSTEPQILELTENNVRPHAL